MRRLGSPPTGASHGRRAAGLVAEQLVQAVEQAVQSLIWMLPPMDAGTRLAASFAFTGVSLEAHLTATRRDAFSRAGARPIRELPHLKHGQNVKIGGLIVARQHPPTAKGFCFLAVEDPDGMVNVVVPPAVYEQSRQAIHSAFVIVDGWVQKDHGAINVLAAAVREV